jgi:hypothetical protein
MVIREAGLASVTGGLPGYRVVRPIEVTIDCRALPGVAQLVFTRVGQ